MVNFRIISLMMLSSAAAVATSVTKTTVDLRVIRSPKTENHVPYVLAPSYHEKFATPLQTEESFAALLKQAEEALKGYQTDKIEQPAVYTKAKAVTKPEIQYKYVYAAPAVKYNYVPVSYQNQVDHTNDYGSYHKFGYRVQDPHSGAAFGHSEVSEGHVTRGQYHVLLPDGRLQNVKYVADHDGYHATVSYENQKYYLA